MIRRLTHLCFITDQLDVMKAFYSETLGLAMKIVFKNKDGEIFGYYFDCGDSSFIEIFDRVLMHKQWGGDGKLPEMSPGFQFRHFCFEVTGLADLKKTLEGKGLKVTELKRGMDRSWQAWISDPDGNAVEMMEYTTESLQVQRSHEAGIAT